jgi:hypothetical protein
MRPLYTLILLLIIVTASGQGRSTVNITIKGEIPEKVYYTSPVNGLCNSLFTEYGLTDTNGSFDIEVLISKPLIIRILLGEHYFLILEPNKHYKLEVIIENGGIVKFRNNQPTELQKFYDTLPNRNPFSCQYFTEDEIKNYVNTYNQLRAMLSSEIQNLEKYSSNIPNNSEGCSLLKMERTVYYSTLISHLASASNLQFLKTNQTTPGDVFAIWNSAFSEVDFTAPITLQTSQIYYLTDLYLWFRIYDRYSAQEIREVRAHHREQRQIFTHTISLANEFLPKEILEFYTASFLSLHTRQTRNQKEKEFVSLLISYEQRFPASPYISFFQENIKLTESKIEPINNGW